MSYLPVMNRNFFFRIIPGYPFRKLPVKIVGIFIDYLPVEILKSNGVRMSQQVIHILLGDFLMIFLDQLDEPVGEYTFQFHFITLCIINMLFLLLFYYKI